jgi:hypothetical protein
VNGILISDPAAVVQGRRQLAPCSGKPHQNMETRRECVTYPEPRHHPAESGATRTPIPVQGGQHSGDCGQRVMMA